MRRPLRVGLLWHSANSGNLGVGALTVANMALAREAAIALGRQAEFVVVGMGEDGGESYLRRGEADVFSVNLRSLLSPGGCWSLFRRLDCVLDIGGGDSFTEIYGPKRFFFLWWSKMLAIGRSRPLLLSPQTIGPFNGTTYRLLARIVLTRAKAVVARDAASLQALQELAPKARAILSADVAFALPYEDQRASRGQGKVRVGLNVSGLLEHEARSGRNRFRLQADYAELTRRLLLTLCARDDVEVCLVSHVRGAADGYDNDDPAAVRYAEAFPGAMLAPRFASPSEAKSYISGLDFLVAGRMHACIAAISAGVPVVPVAYSRKFAGLFEMLDYPWTLPVTGFDTDAAAQFILACFERRVQLAADAARACAKAETLLDTYRAELRRFFAAAA